MSASSTLAAEGPHLADWRPRLVALPGISVEPEIHPSGRHPEPPGARQPSDRSPYARVTAHLPPGSDRKCAGRGRNHRSV